MDAFVSQSFPRLRGKEYEAKQKHVFYLLNKRKQPATSPAPCSPARELARALRRTVLPPSKRRRQAGGGNLPIAPQIWWELWDLFINIINNIKGRVPTWFLLEHARSLAKVIHNDWKLKVETGQASPDDPPQLPALTEAWLIRWRRAFGISWRRVNKV